MFDHVKFGVSDYAASKAFFLKALEPLGVAVVSEGPPTYGVPFRSTFEGSIGVELNPQSTSPLRVRGGVLLRTSPWKRRAILDYSQAFLTFGVGLKTSRIRV